MYVVCELLSSCACVYSVLNMMLVSKLVFIRFRGLIVEWRNEGLLNNGG